MNEHDKTAEYKITCALPEGTGYGEGLISVAKRLNDPEDPLTSEIMNDVHAVITGAEVLVPIESDDDGCPDGRRAGRLMKGLKSMEHTYSRAKAFGGGLTQSVATQVGLGRAKTGLKKLFKSEAQELDEAGVDYGAHTHTHASGDKCGCGAIDEAPVIVGNTSEYKDEIKDTLTALSGLLNHNGVDASSKNIDEILTNYEEYKQKYQNDDYKGKEVMEGVLEKEKVVAELEDDHLEVAIIINTVDGMTFKQELVRSVTNDVAQVFPIDLPRKINIAAKRYKDESEEVKSKAVLSMLAYALSTAATLTDGTLPVYIIEPVEEKQRAVQPALI